MPLNKAIKKVLVIGSGPIVIGQAAEFDYAGTQAIKALKQDGITVVLVNSNPATIMTDNSLADIIYLEPLTLKTLQRIVIKEKPDSILSGLGGQIGLTLCMELSKNGFLKEHNVSLIGANIDSIMKAEDRQEFLDTMNKINKPCIPSKVVNTVEDAVEFSKVIGFPIIIRPAFTLGGSGGGIVNDEHELREISRNGLMLSPISQVLVEKCISGWKEIEFEVMRDKNGNKITVCSMENFDPVGIHTGDSIVIAPAVTLSDKEYQMLRSAALEIIEELKIIGGCNCQFALNPDSFDYAVIEVNPRVSRSSALASKATGYPIAKVSTKLALGYTLDEIINEVTGKTYAMFEPALDYVAVKFPKWAFDKFVYAKRELGTQMKATGEVMAIGNTFKFALMQAIRGAEIGHDTLNYDKFVDSSEKEINNLLKNATDERIFVVYEAIKRGYTIEKIHDITKIDNWFLSNLYDLYNYEKQISGKQINDDEYELGKKLGYTDLALKRISGHECPKYIAPIYKMVDTCAGEFLASTPYFYEYYGEEKYDDATDFIKKNNKPTVIVIGSGPIRIGQGIEFDYASVHCVWSLKRLGYNVVIINNNPETVSTDYDTGDRLYFAPLNFENVFNIVNLEKPVGVVVAFGGQTAIKLAKQLSENNIRIIGSSYETIDMAEDREKFLELLESLNIKSPKGFTVFSEKEALEVANKLKYPVLIRPSYVLGGQNMIIANCDEDICEYMKIILNQGITNPVLIDKYLSGIEIEVDAICDGKDVLIPGIMEHVERTGIHSGDSIAVYPPLHISDELADKIFDTTKAICTGLSSIGLINLQYIIKDGEIYVIEVNPRASRTVPYLSKVTGIHMCELATKVSLGIMLADLGYSSGIYKSSPYVTVKVPVFSFEKLIDVDTQLGPEMKSTGEVLGIGKDFKEAIFKGLKSSGCEMAKHGGVFISVRDSDKEEIPYIAKGFLEMGFKIYATEGTKVVLERLNIPCIKVDKIHQGEKNAMALLESGKVNYVISTSKKGRDPHRDSVKIRRRATLLGVPCITSLDTAKAVIECLKSGYSEINTELVDINELRGDKMEVKFTKMQGCGNDYIYINVFKQKINSPESLSIFCSDRHFGIGGDGIVLICPSDVADAKMRMFNLDGSEGKMCGNAIRCVAKYLYDNKLVNKTVMHIDTLSGIKELKIKTKNNLVCSAEVDMGRAELKTEKIPSTLPYDETINKTITVDGKDYNITLVSMGNPHCVMFVDEVDNLEISKIGPVFENLDIFPERMNVEFVKIISHDTIKMRVWERGSGETLACGTGACAAATASYLNGHTDNSVKVMLLGGELKVTYTEDKVLMEGPCEKVFDGTVMI